ncbi:MAG: putative transmembrane protein (PGPGW) [Nitrospira sp. OLB3]|nr:MAG: putative transmembrane protein (PGPGW) [Nitrospira sp. OLB3]
MGELLTQIESFVPAKLLIWFAVSSGVMFVGTLIAIPIILMRLPADYFDIRKPRPWMENHHPILRLVGHIVKNLVGAIFLFAGFLMLFLPGQGVLTMLIGLSLIEFPGKRRLEAKIVGQSTVLSTINAMRAKFDKPPLIIAPE